MKQHALTLILAIAALVAISSDAIAAGPYPPPNWSANGTAVTCDKSTGDRVRCLAHGVGSVLVTVKSRSDEEVKFSYDEYHSVCGSGSNLFQSTTYTLAPNGTITFRALGAGAGINCREVFIAACRVNDEAKPCSDLTTTTFQWYNGNVK